MDDLSTGALVTGIVVLEGEHILAAGCDESEAMASVPGAWQASPLLQCVPASMKLVRQVQKRGSVPFVVVDGMLCTIDDVDNLLAPDDATEVPCSPEVEQLLARTNALVADNDEDDVESTG
ncbi:hypothetical protein [Kushneria marisflavi]|uniref:Uncharacterized protein n=1 Tax=Kushneria marisflavi TaxID=157779 RepID=A0A240UR64_9GAMM|nr:hypothetical protein [Kushneria marisflavi]ART63997.1 hypothetical protein B9H00_13785 [Kushneria marisflavi]RKD85722.1 hypothetical protein C8D96_1614 [Kushneria marisflavi]